MTSVTVIHVGDFREKYFREAESEYIKRLRPFCDYRTIAIPEESTHGEESEKLILRAMEKEASLIRRSVPQKCVKIALCVEGKPLTSEAFASVFEKTELPICFIIGSSFGLDEGFKRECDIRLSLSAMTFPHRLARIMLAEQVYRAISINNNKKYHK